MILLTRYTGRILFFRYLNVFMNTHCTLKVPLEILNDTTAEYPN